MTASPPRAHLTESGATAELFNELNCRGAGFGVRSSNPGTVAMREGFGRLGESRASLLSLIPF